MAQGWARDWRRLAIAVIAAAGVVTVFAFDAQSQAPAKKGKAQAPQAQEDGEQAEEQQDAAPKSAPKRKKQDPVEAQRAIDGALKQLEAGKADQAVTALSTTLAGYAIDHFGRSVAFLGLAAVAVCGLALLWLLLPETRLREKQSLPASRRRLEFVTNLRRRRISAFAAARQFASRFRKAGVRCGEMNISSAKSAI